MVFIIVMNQDDARVPILPEDDGEDATEYTEFAGTVFLNGDELELENTPLVAKGLLHLPLLELAEALNIQIITYSDSNTIFIREEADVDGEDDLKIYIGETEVTPANIVIQDDDYFIEAKELVPLLGAYFYENLFANAAYLADDSLPRQDGEYTVVRRRDARGWAPELRLTVLGGSISAVQYLELDEDGNNKFDNQEYLNNWLDANPEMEDEPTVLIAQLEAELLDNQSVGLIDVTTGATGSWKNFLQLTSVALGKSLFDAIPQQVPDGNYVAVGNPSNQGWTPVIEFTVTEGLISDFAYDEVNQEGNSKRADDQYLQNWRNAFSEVDPIAIILEREQNILVTQDPNVIDATTGATSWGVNIKQYTTGALDHASRAELPEAYSTIYVFFGEGTDRGDRPQLLIAALDDDVLLADFSDYRNGIAKKFDQPYLQAWKDQYPDVDPLAILAEMESTFIETEDPDELDGITGATSWRNSFQNLAGRGLEFIR